MNILDTYFMVMGGAPPPRPAYAPPPPPKAPAPIDNSASMRQKAAENKKRGRSALIASKDGASGLGGESSGQKKTLGGY
jgi:hypothetical protein|tara:strand:+ start:255 stop:491 length:237 start_codon:yes stop_codon:yes gene_type:complete